MTKITMLTLKAGSDSRPIHFRSSEDALKWLNLNSIDSFSVFVSCSTGKNHRGTFRYASEFVEWIETIK